MNVISGQGEGRQAEAVPAARHPGQGTQIRQRQPLAASL